MVIQSKRVWIGGQFIAAQIEIAGEKIVSVLPYDSKKADNDFGEKRILPGFIDIHTHGAYGFDTNDANEDGLRNWAKKLPEEGVTSFLPTTVTQSNEVLTKALQNVDAVKKKGTDGAEILGVHFEGPYISLKYKGAQPEPYVMDASVEQFKQYQADSNNVIKLITLAPEVDENLELTKYCAQNGVAVSMGHSGATYEQALIAIANGAKSMTHVYNAMTPYNHRQPGLVGTALRVRDIYGEIITDLVHSDASVVNNFYTAKGADYTIMISDSLNAKGLPKDKYIFGGNTIVIGDTGSAYLENGTLAGSTLKINQGLKNLIEKALVPVAAAINSCTSNPARLIGADDRKGRLCAGFDADIVILNDDYSVDSTICRGVRAV